MQCTNTQSLLLLLLLLLLLSVIHVYHKPSPTHQSMQVKV
jgi:hypothetical protein